MAYQIIISSWTWELA